MRIVEPFGAMAGADEAARAAGLSDEEGAVLTLAVRGGRDEETLSVAERRVLRRRRLPRGCVSLRSAILLLLDRGGSWSAADLYRLVRQLIPEEQAVDCHERHFGAAPRSEMVRRGRRLLVVRAMSDLAYRARNLERYPGSPVVTAEGEGRDRRWRLATV